MALQEMIFFAPELILCVMAFLLIIYGSYIKRETTSSMVGLLAVFSLLLAYILIKGKWGMLPEHYEAMALSNDFILFAKALLMVAALMNGLLAFHWGVMQKHGAFEYPVMVLFATIGLSLVISANSFLSFYVALELASLSMYVMAAYERDNADSCEAGLKYFILGSLASCILLFGISLVYGFAGTIEFDALARAIETMPAPANSGLIAGLVLILIALCFKLAAAPFHMWSPDVYQGAPTPVVSFFAIAPKIAVLCLLTRLMLTSFADVAQHLQQVLIFAAIASMVIGAVAGLVQQNIKRLIAYSAIGHVGYVLLAVVVGTQQSAQAMLIYMAVYMSMSLAFFALLLLLQKNGKEITEIKELAGLSLTHPKLALCMAVTLFSMAGIPPLAGFFSKALLLMSVVQAGFTPLVVVAVLCSVIACFYYIRMVKVMYFDEAEYSLHIAEGKLVIGSVLVVSLAMHIVVIMPYLLLEPTKFAAKALFP
jgi:NADH-quinone oxidoreductase subunit N